MPYSIPFGITSRAYEKSLGIVEKTRRCLLIRMVSTEGVIILSGFGINWIRIVLRGHHTKLCLEEIQEARCYNFPQPQNRTGNNNFGPRVIHSNSECDSRSLLKSRDGQQEIYP